MNPALRAGLLLAVYLLIFILGTPGFDFLEGPELQEPAARARLERRAGPFWAALGLGLYDFSQATRVPLVQWLAPLQRPFRISQNWSLYRDGPGACERLEIRVDGQAIYRSVDPQLSWNEADFRNRRMRPVVEALVMDPSSPNWRGLYRWILKEARGDFPGMAQLELVALHGPFPCDAMKERHRVLGLAPGWVPVMVAAESTSKGTADGN